MSIVDLLFPSNIKCVTCGDETNKIGICEECLKYLTLVPSPSCEICGGENFGSGKVCIECKGRNFIFERNFAVFSYIGDVRNKIIDFKQNSHKAIGEMFSYFILNEYENILRNINIDVIVPIPISAERLKLRKFNQSEVLCSKLIRDYNVNCNILKRTKDTPHQTGLSRKNREINLKNSFEINDKSLVKNKTILLVDDIYTTGATLNACASILKKAGANKIYTLTLARTPVKKDRILD